MLVDVILWSIVVVAMFIAWVTVWLSVFSAGNPPRDDSHA